MRVFSPQNAYSLIVPGLPTKYPGGAVSIDLGLGQLPTIDINPVAEGGISLVFPIAFDFNVAPEGSNASVTGFSFTAASNLTLTLNLTSAGTLSISGDVEYLGADGIPGLS